MVAIYGREGVTPGRVVYTGSLNDGRALSWLYVVAVVGDIVSGVRFDNSSRAGAHNLGWFGTTLDALTGQSTFPTHNLSVVDWWPDVVADFLATPATFPDVTLPSVAPAPTPELSGDMIPREHVVTRLTRASEIASQYADDNSLCGEFERCMEAIGLQDLGLMSLRERERLYRVTYTREVEDTCDSCGHDIETTETSNVDLYIEARNDDHALDLVFEAYADNLTGWDGDTEDVYLTRL